MKINHLFASAAIAVLMTVAVPAQAQLLGGGMRGGAGGALGGTVGGGLGAMPGGMGGSATVR